MKNRYIALAMLVLALILTLNSCYRPPIDNTENSDNNNSDITESYTPANYDPDDDDLNINWGYGCKLDGVVYMLSKEGLRYYENGEMKTICRDPLCKHKDFTCPSNSTISTDLVTTDGQKLYCLGGYFQENQEYKDDIEAGRIPDGDEFIWYDCVYEIDVQMQKLKVITKWRTTGTGTLLLRVHGDYVYYLIATSQTKSDLYRVKKSGGDSELVSKNNKGYISNVVFGDNIVLYRRGTSYYKTDMDFETSELFTDKILSFVTVKDEYIYYATADRKTFDCIGSTKKLTLNKADIYRIELNNWKDLSKSELLLEDASTPDGFVITENKIIYLPKEPVYLGEKTVDGEIKDSYDYSNGKVMELNLDTLEKKTIYSELVAAETNIYKINYADDNQVVLNNYRNTYYINILTSELTKLKAEN